MTDEQRVMAAIRASEAQVDDYATSLRGRGFESYLDANFQMVDEARRSTRKKQGSQPGVEWLIPALLVVAAGAILLSR
tara:strand:+ start:582 stop:815 length:234 start_codon:yes stop_codon:yes gene_type:complete